MDVESRYNLGFSSVCELLRDPRYQQIMHRTMPVQRVWGWVGYFWLELLSDLRSGEISGQCQRCGALIHGTARKRFCSGDDDPGCFRERRAADKRTERARSK